MANEPETIHQGARPLFSIEVRRRLVWRLLPDDSDENGAYRQQHCHEEQYCVRAENPLGTNTACARLYVTAKPDLRITEVQAYPVTGCADHHDWFEVTNFGTNAVNLLGFYRDRPADGKGGRILGNVFRLGRTRLRDVMVPRERVVAIDRSIDSDALLDLIKESAFTRIPVYRFDKPGVAQMLDEDLFSFGLSLSHADKVRGRRCKTVLRQVARRWLPAEVALKGAEEKNRCGKLNGTRC